MDMLKMQRTWVRKIVRVCGEPQGLDEDYFAEEGFHNDGFEYGCFGEYGVVVGFEPIIGGTPKRQEAHHLDDGWWIVVDINGLHIQCEPGDLEIIDPC